MQQHQSSAQDTWAQNVTPILCVGSFDECRQICPQISGQVAPRCISVFEISAAFFAKTQPRIIVSTPFMTALDPVALAARLAESGYRGIYCAVVAPDPNPTALRLEIARVAPDLTLELIVLDEMSLRAH